MKRIILSTTMIAMIGMLAGAGTFAWFSDEATSTGNSFTAGSIDLKIRDNNEDFGDGVTATWTATNMKPGDEFPFEIEFVTLKNVGSTSGDHLEITCDYSVIEESPQTEADTDKRTDEHPEEMAKQMIITRCEYYEDDVWNINCLDGTYTGTLPTPSGYTVGDWKITDEDGDGKITFHDLKLVPLDNLPFEEWPDFELSVKFSEGADSDFQGDTFNLTMIFTLNQHPSQ